jgi:hypothetical protein
VQSTHCDAADSVVTAASDEGALLEQDFSTLGYLTYSIYMYLIVLKKSRVEKLRIIYNINIEFELFVD